MKKGILAFVTLTIIVTSCKKEMQNQPIQANKTEEGTNSNASQARVVQNKDMKDYIVYDGNPEMTKLNTALYLYMSGMRKVFLQNTTCVDNLHNKIKTPDKGVLLDEFINGSGNCKTINKFI